MSPLSDNQTEVECRPHDRISVSVRALRHRSPTSTAHQDGDLKTHLDPRRRHLKASDLIREGSGSNSQMSNMAKSVGGLTRLVECVGDVLSMGPCLHQTRRGEGQNAHRWSIPGILASGSRLPMPRTVRDGLGPTTKAADRHQLNGQWTDVGSIGSPTASITCCCDLRKCLWIDHGHTSGIVEEGQMANLIPHRPPCRRCRKIPFRSRCPEGSNDATKVGVFALEIVEKCGQRGGSPREARAQSRPGAASRRGSFGEPRGSQASGSSHHRC